MKKTGNYSQKVKWRAHRAVARAIRRGDLLPVSEYKCFLCGKRKAKHYHHESYLEKDFINVLPMCMGCHRKRHYEIDNNGGVIPGLSEQPKTFCMDNWVRFLSKKYKLVSGQITEFKIIYPVVFDTGKGELSFVKIKG